jgi:hypothetical protein
VRALVARRPVVPSNGDAPLRSVSAVLRPCGGPDNEALQQTKPGITTPGPVFAAERRC